jgi:methylenetetrahydrofolate dehydrogenase (NADP+)/methenyltetrahydrofolate cyclohydrolase
MVQKIDGAAIAARVKKKIAAEIYKFDGPRPNLAIILVGEREDSQLYVSLKEREGKKVGIDTHLYKIKSDVAEEEILATIDFLNKDDSIDGILIQLPLPEKFNTDKIVAAVKPGKDVDGFHAQHPDYIVSPVLASVSACLEKIKFSAPGKTACVLHNSDVFGLSVKKLLEDRGLKVVLKEKPEEADLLVSALGRPNFIKADMIKSGAVIIDIGITKVEGRVCGDADYKSIKNKAGFITPVPGGIGPMTIAFLFKNVLEIYRRRNIK